MVNSDYNNFTKMQSFVGPSYRVKWSDHYNSAWVFEGAEAICCLREATLTMFEHLVSSKEIIVSAGKPVLNQTVNVPDFEFENPTLDDQKRNIICQLLAQLELASAVCLESPFFAILRKRILIIHRILYALYFKFHDKDRMSEPPNPVSMTTSVEQKGSASRIVDPSQIATNALLEMGIKTGLSLLFNILRLNWSEGSTNSSLCNDILRTAADVLWALPPLSLSNEQKIPAIGLQSLKEVGAFLQQIVHPRSGASVDCRVLGAEIMLGLSIQRGSLQHILQWIYMVLSSCGERKDELYIEKSVFSSALNTIRQCAYREIIDSLPQLLEETTTDRITLYSAAIILMEELVSMSIKANLKEDPDGINDEMLGVAPPLPTPSLGGGHPEYSARPPPRPQKTSKVFVWGSNSSYQLGESGPDRVLTPRRAANFCDVDHIEAGQYCTFAVSANGLLSACGKGCYGRLGLGDSSNQPIPKQLPISPEVRFKYVSSSKGSDGHTLALTTNGQVYSWGDGDYGKLGHAGVATEKYPRLITGVLGGKVVKCISAGFRHSAAVTEGGELYTWGEGESGRLGHGDTNDRQVPTLVKDVCNVGAVSCGGSHTLAVSVCGKIVWSFGAGEYGKLGHSSVMREIRPKVIEALQGYIVVKLAAAAYASFCITEQGELFGWGTGVCLGRNSNESKILVPERVNDLICEKVIDICCGESHVLVLTDKYEVWAWGNNSMGQCGVGSSVSPLLKARKVVCLDGAKITQISAGTSHSIAWTSSKSTRMGRNNQCTPFWMDIREETLSLLKKFLQIYGLNFASIPPPFSTEMEHENFVVLCLRLLNGHCSVLVSKQSVLSSAIDKQFSELRKLFFSMLDMNLPECVQLAVGETLLTGAPILLPPLKEKLSLLLEMLKNVSDLSKGQALLCNVIFTSLEDHQQVSYILGMARPPNPLEYFAVTDLTSTKELMTSLLRILADDLMRRLNSIEKSVALEVKDVPLNSFYQRLHDLLTSLQNHIFAHCFCSSEVRSDFDKYIWEMQREHFSELFGYATAAFRKIAEILLVNQDLHFKVAAVLYSAFAGSMLSRILHTMVLMAGTPFNALIGPLLTVLVTMESIVRKLPSVEVQRYHEEWSPDAQTPTAPDAESAQQMGKLWTWFLDMERTGSHLVGRLVGGMIRGVPHYPEEQLCKNWLTGQLFSHGLETCLPSPEDVTEKLSNIFILRQDNWMDTLRQVLDNNLGLEKASWFNLILPVTVSNENSASELGNITCLYELMFEHAKSLDWDTCDVVDDLRLDSASRVLLLALLKHTGLLGQIAAMTVPESRHNSKLDEIFALLFFVRTKLLSLKQDQLLNKKSPITATAPLTEEPSTSAAVSHKISTTSVSNDDVRRDAQAMSQVVCGGNTARLERARERALEWDEDPELFPRLGRNHIPPTTLEELHRREQGLFPSMDFSTYAALGCDPQHPRMHELISESLDGELDDPDVNNYGVTSSTSSRCLPARPVSGMRYVGRSSRGRSSRDFSSRVAPPPGGRSCPFRNPPTPLFQGPNQNGGGGGSSSSSFGVIDLTRDTDTEDDGYNPANDPPSPPTPIETSAPFMTSVHTTTRPQVLHRHDDAQMVMTAASESVRPPKIKSTSNVQNPVTPAPQLPAEVSPEEPAYEDVCQAIIRKSMLLICVVKTSFHFKPLEQSTVTAHQQLQHADIDKEVVDVYADELLLLDYDDDDLPSTKSSEAFKTSSVLLNAWYNSVAFSSRSTMEKKGIVLVRKLGRSIIKFVAHPVVSSKHDWLSSSPSPDALGAAAEGWNTEPSTVMQALKRQQERALMRLEAIGKIFELVSNSQLCTSSSSAASYSSEGNQVDANFLSSVIEFLLAGCFQLGIVPALNAGGTSGLGGANGSIASSEQFLLQGFDPQLQLSHYLDSIQAAPYDLKQNITGVVHKVMQWIIRSLQDQVFSLEDTSLDGIMKGSSSGWNSQSDDVKLLNLFALSGRFSAADVRIMVNAGLLNVLERFCQAGPGGGTEGLGGTSCLGKINAEVWSSLPYPHYVTVASVRLLHMIAVSCAIHVHRLEEFVVEKVVDVLYSQLASLLTTLYGSQIVCDGDISPTPVGTPDTPVVSLSPVSESHKSICTSFSSLKLETSLSPSDKQDLENRLGDFFVFLRRLVSRGPMGKFFCRPHWIKLILSFLSFKACADADTFLKMDTDESIFESGGVIGEVSSGGNRPPSENEGVASSTKETETHTLSPLGVQLCRRITLSPGMRPRLLAVQLLEYVLSVVPNDSSELKQQVIKDLLQQLHDCLWIAPLFDRAKRNILNREEIYRIIYGESLLAERTDAVKVTFDPEKSLCCFIEGGQTLVHGRGGRGYGVSNIGFTSGCHQWKFLIVKENRGNEGTCVGVAKWPIKDQSHRTSEDMWLYRAYSGNLYHKGELNHALPSYSQGDYITVVLDVDNKTLSFGKNGEEPALAFQDVDAAELHPCVLFYSTNPGEKVKITDYEPKRPLKTLVAGEPHCAPTPILLAEAHVSLIRKLHTHDGWTKIV